MPVITQTYDQKRYDELLNARRTSVIEAAKLVYQTNQWIKKREWELLPISEFQRQMESRVAAGTMLGSEVQDIVKQQEQRIQELNAFKRMLAQFEQKIQEYNTLQQPAELKWYSNANCYYPHALVSLEEQSLSHWYHQQGCDVSGTKFYASLRAESNLARPDTSSTSSISSREVFAGAGMVLGVILFLGGEILGVVVNPLFLILMVVGIALLIYSNIALISDEPRPPLVADNYIKHETPVVSDYELAYILQTGQAPLPANAIFPEPSAPPLPLMGIFSHNLSNEDRQGEGDEVAYSPI